jgi:hypothetical protein
MFVAGIFIALFFMLKTRIETNRLEAEFTLEVEKNKLHQLSQGGFMDSILSVKKFNDWFNSPKDSSIYAHPGIFLRLDKLSAHHIDDYIKMTTYDYLEYEDFDFKKMRSFEDRIRKDWMKKKGDGL